MGKTSLIQRFVHDEFDDRYIATMGAKVTKKEFEVAPSPSEKPRLAVLTIWDIMGAKGLRELLREAYFQGTQGVLAVCDVTRPETLNDLEDWRRHVEGVAGPVPTYLLANKIDLTEEARLKESDVKTFAREWEAPYLLTSAKTGDNVEEAFHGLAELILEAQLARQEA